MRNYVPIGTGFFDFVRHMPGPFPIDLFYKFLNDYYHEAGIDFAQTIAFNTEHMFSGVGDEAYTNAQQRNAMDALFSPRHADRIVAMFGEHNLTVRVYMAAARRGYVHTARALVEWGYITDPAVNQSDALRIACQAGQVDVVRYLLADGRCDPVIGDCMRNAVLFRHPGVLAELLRDGRADPRDAFQTACSSGTVDSVRMLLADARVDPRANYSNALDEAVRGNHPSVVQLLLDDGRSDADLIFITYIYSITMQMAELLLRSGRVKTSFISDTVRGRLYAKRRDLSRLIRRFEAEAKEVEKKRQRVESCITCGSMDLKYMTVDGDIRKVYCSRRCAH